MKKINRITALNHLNTCFSTVGQLINFLLLVNSSTIKNIFLLKYINTDKFLIYNIILCHL